MEKPHPLGQAIVVESGDAAHAQCIRDLARQLQQAIAEAAVAGLAVEVAINTSYRVAGREHPTLDVFISRPL